MNSKRKNIYILGTGLSHDGSACLLKNGRICVAIEKERITRVKHDGGNDVDAINYCLAAEGISLNDVDLIVQNANYGFFEFGNDYYGGPRLFTPEIKVPVITISHHLAHAYYALGTCPFENTAIFVLDGCGSLYDECIDLEKSIVHPNTIETDIKHLYAEKDSYYLFRNNQFKTIYKDFSPFGLTLKNYPMHPGSTKHSIGGVYSAASAYCFQNDSDTGKLMGLAPYGHTNVYEEEIFELKDGRVFVKYDWMLKFDKPARSSKDFWDNFQYYADIAYWVQRETEKAIIYVLKSRKEMLDVENLSFTGGVALNAVANKKILDENIFSNYYFTPAAGDNGLSIGCAYYGWLEVLKKERIVHDGGSAYGKKYTRDKVQSAIQNFICPDAESYKLIEKLFFENINNFINQGSATKEYYHIRFIFSDASTYNLSFRFGKVVESNAAFQEPDCLLFMNVSTFISSLIDKSIIVQSIEEKKTIITGDIRYFLNIVKLDELGLFVRNLVNKNPRIKKVGYVEEKDICKAAAKLLAEGKIIAWFQGGAEFGPRALGHRSILADPRTPGVQKFINNRIKFREDFRPFAPAVLKEEVSTYFDYSGESPYMILTAPVKEKWKDIITGVIHVDNSARIQTVTQEDNEMFYKLIREFKSLTGLPVLLNTSFNKKSMPIIETPEQALAYFFECDLDSLVIDNFLISK